MLALLYVFQQASKSVKASRHLNCLIEVTLTLLFRSIMYTLFGAYQSFSEFMGHQHVKLHRFRSLIACFTYFQRTGQ